MAIINSSRFINSVMLPLSSCGTNPFAFRVIRKKVCWRMTANRLPNHVTPTNKVFPIVSVACAITSIWDKGVHVRHIMQEFGEKISDFLHFYSKDGKLFKRFVFCYRENLILVGNIVQRYKKKPRIIRGQRNTMLEGVISSLLHFLLQPEAFCC